MRTHNFAHNSTIPDLPVYGFLERVDLLSSKFDTTKAALFLLQFV